MLINLLSSLSACPICQADLAVPEKEITVQCACCQAVFHKNKNVWNFIPERLQTSPEWHTWMQLQQNGLASYQADPEHNLSVGARSDSRQFAEFCNYHGLVLDVGCGPQRWPAYFDSEREAIYVGIDPLAETSSSDFLRFKALAEYLPFRARTFDHVLFSTTLDHFVDPRLALQAAARVCKESGEIDVWLGEKRPDAPKPVYSPEWYRRLSKPELAEDMFHMKRMDLVSFQRLVQLVSLRVVETEHHQIDPYRTNHFYRLRVGV